MSCHELSMNPNLSATIRWNDYRTPLPEWADSLTVPPSICSTRR